MRSDRLGRSSVVGQTRLAMVGVAALSIAVVFVIFFFAWMQFTVSVRTQELSRQVTALAAGLSAGGPLEESVEGEIGLRERLFRVQAGLIGARLLITDALGEVTLTTVTGGQGPSRVDTKALGEPDANGTLAAVLPSEDNVRMLVVAVPLSGSSAGWLVALQPVREIAGVRIGVALLLFGSATIAIFVAWVVGSYLAHRLTAPLLRLRSGVEAITAGEWGHQVDVEGAIEIASLAATFNEMSSRVADAYTAQKHFVGDVSHELRTPITSIQGFAGALLDGTAGDEETARRFASVIKQEAQRLSNLTETLLALADLDAGRVDVARASIDTAALSDTLRSRHAEQAEAKSLRFDIEALAGCSTQPLGDDARVLQVASALVSNALRCTPTGGTIRVSAEAGGGMWRLVVEDSGPGVPPEDRERIFERFVRLDSSRASAEGGSGLGLSICARLMGLMDGRIRVGESLLGGARFEVELPCA